VGVAVANLASQGRPLVESAQVARLSRSARRAGPGTLQTADHKARPAAQVLHGMWAPLDGNPGPVWTCRPSVSGLRVRVMGPDAVEVVVVGVSWKVTVCVCLLHAARPLLRCEV
jgi:hypothetical protein